MKITALIMAGGKGERFWPKSRANCPKQFIDITGCGKTMLQLTAERILPLTSIEDIYIVTNADYSELVAEQLPYVPKENILCEPVGRNTAPCIGLGAAYILKRNADAVVLVLAADHLIKQEEDFRNILREAIVVAEQGENVVTIGITPDRPETNYGYIKKGKEAQEGQVVRVEKFVEKPDLQTAIRYLQSGNYLWNSGIFVWKASTIMALLQQYLPDIYRHIRKIGDGIGSPQEFEIIKEEFSAMRSVSVDYGIMEYAENLYVLAGTFGWDDVGSWLALERIKNTDSEGNLVNGNVVTTGTRNCIIEGGEKLIATVGLDDVVIIDTQDVVLVADKQHIGDIRNVLEEIRINCLQEKYL
ncbi:MAG: mannose-1-phosphate guanylyltransferase [Lachnospiraceae bacterium]|nr:mannose-1-phosphate guanylyltransferase [Lachnospiraceae bacterium]